MNLQSAAFQAGEPIPARYTCEGDNISPALSWSDLPERAQSCVLIMHDPDAPRPGGFTHWVVYNIPAKLRRLEENQPRRENLPSGGLQGRNDAGQLGYTGPCPPSGTHRYFLRLFALDSVLALPPGATADRLMPAIAPHRLAEAELMGTYVRHEKRGAA